MINIDAKHIFLLISIVSNINIDDVQELYLIMPPLICNEAKCHIVHIVQPNQLWLSFDYYYHYLLSFFFFVFLLFAAFMLCFLFRGGKAYFLAKKKKKKRNE